MPTYDYKCESCGHLFEHFQSMAEDPLKTCPDCRKDSLKRLIGGGMGVIFKGSGFYVNDAKKSAGTSQPLKDKSDSKESPAQAVDSGKTSDSGKKSDSEKKSEAKSAS
ncbi:zinc ribbon domain-containing protein [Oceanispirochaeta sp.]|jgi:putative FmdB family regulatory protein|uniref:FmdB family zinc ribbon protein n=1 Tax=Oceanispirochaeta sp. TaxID=2035350 RepID=UPI002631455A|nr:zinc ribbon domain-containing protein [Oceanispirochaeta sp.]MDA3957504.1 zinc ribbon domain-containing protein [Oceanispirochaeta sp.]